MSLKQRLEQVNTSGKSAKTSDHSKDPFSELKGKIQNKVISELDIDFTEISEDNDELKQEIQMIIAKNIEKESLNLTSAQKRKVAEELLNEIIGFGPITAFLNDSAVTEIMVNGPKQIFVERDGKLTLESAIFKDNNHILHVIKKIVGAIGRRIDESSPMVDARLKNGSRVNAIIPPLAIDGPSLTIRKFAEDPFMVDDLIGFGTLTSKMAELLRACVEGRLNIIVSGGTGSGKTTTLNVLSSFIPEDERIVTIEDAAELQLLQTHIVRLETRPPNIEGKGEITIRDLVKNSLRMRPDRIVVGEVRSGEALDMLQAMNTGHDGSLTTAHANSPRDMLSRLETMVLMSGMNLPIRAVRDQVSSAVDLIVQQSRLQDGSRRITYITEVLGMEGDVIILQDIFKFVQKGIDSKGRVVGDFEFTGIIPRFLKNLRNHGIELPQSIFQ
ncbi:CpaF family protein [Acidaminobacter sp. JC074]|uniref:CpaF family protein n=1 Tax=Acidaminobacter sp. JC074 TaxID=2530199 RepID=UPI001F0DF908|nr:CpaF family protein [Acidaminobacter sp. JC074]MCH4890440.1 CpaF family protein [Acidaminobacter sp. JC074]